MIFITGRSQLFHLGLLLNAFGHISESSRILMCGVTVTLPSSIIRFIVLRDINWFYHIQSSSCFLDSELATLRAVITLWLSGIRVFNRGIGKSPPAAEGLLISCRGYCRCQIKKRQVKHNFGLLVLGKLILGCRVWRSAVRIDRKFDGVQEKSLTVYITKRNHQKDYENHD